MSLSRAPGDGSIGECTVGYGTEPGSLRIIRADPAILVSEGVLAEASREPPLWSMTYRDGLLRIDADQTVIYRIGEYLTRYEASLAQRVDVKHPSHEHEH